MLGMLLYADAVMKAPSETQLLCNVLAGICLLALLALPILDRLDRKKTEAAA